MFQLTDAARSAFADDVGRAAASPELVAAVGAIYADFERERADRRPRCDQSGRCCRFETYGHRLFVTTAEVAAFGATIGQARADPGFDGTGCPYQVDGLCNAHAARPFGCRVYFCDGSSTEWQHAQYERFHAALRELHERLGVPYAYVEWRDALAAMGLPGKASLFPLPLPIRRERVGVRVRLSVIDGRRPSP